MRASGEDVAETLDCVPGVFSVERHIRGKRVCVKCETLILTIARSTLAQWMGAAGVHLMPLVEEMHAMGWTPPHPKTASKPQ